MSQPPKMYKPCPVRETVSSRSLWQAVLLLALRDALKMGVGDYEYHQAQGWILNGGADFREVCDMAGFCHKNVQAQYEKMMKKKKFKIGRRS